MDNVTDLTERLREWGRNDAAWGYPERSQDMLSAATTLETLTQENARLREALEAMLLYADPNGEGVYDGANDIVGVKQNGQMVLKGSFITTCIRARKALGDDDE